MSCPSLLRMTHLLAKFCELLAFWVLIPILIWLVSNLIVLFNFMMFLSKWVFRSCLSCKIWAQNFIFRSPMFIRLLHFILRFEFWIFFIVLSCFPPRFKSLSLRILGQFLPVNSKSLNSKLLHVLLNILLLSLSFNFSHCHSIRNLRFIENLFFSFL